MNILLLCPMADNQSGLYIHTALLNMGHKVATFDWREITSQFGVRRMNDEFIGAVKSLKPDLTIVVKGIGIMPETIRKIREFHKNPIVGWIFDPKLGVTLVKDVPLYVDLLKEFDIFYTTDGSAPEELKPLGVNCKQLMEACCTTGHKESVINSIQKRKFGADVVFIGGLDNLHEERMKLMERIHNEGFDFKIYGTVDYKPAVPGWVDGHHTGYMVVNDYHSMVCNSSKIVIGADSWVDRKHWFSARLFRVMCAGAFYLTTETNGIKDIFTPGKHLDVYKDADDMVEKIIKYLQDDELREKIAKAGQEEVLKNHTFEIRLQQIIDDTKAKTLNTCSTQYIIK